MNEDIFAQMRELNRQSMQKIWQLAKTDQLDVLSEEDKQLGEIMLQHQDEFFNQFEFADVIGDYDFDPKSEVNPFLHVMIHSIVENQLQLKDPIEAYQFYNSMRRKKLSHHDTIHLIGSILVPLLFHSMKIKKQFDRNLYNRLLKKYMDIKPDKISAAVNKDLSFIFEG